MLFPARGPPLCGDIQQHILTNDLHQRKRLEAEIKERAFPHVCLLQCKTGDEHGKEEAKDRVWCDW